MTAHVEHQAVLQASGVRPRTDNNFHLVRLVLALMVVACHAVLVPGLSAWLPAAPVFDLFGDIGVQGFFVVSGYLVWTSLERSPSLRVYAEKRVRRLLPAYLCVILGCAVVALVVSENARRELDEVARYVGWNITFLTFMAPDLPGLFETGYNQYTTVNSSLWTLKIEVMFYVVLPLLAVVLRSAGRFQWAILAAIYVSSEAWRATFEWMAGPDGTGMPLNFAEQLPGQMSFFVVGIGMAILRDQIAWRPFLVIAGLAMLALSILFPPLIFCRALGIGIVVIWIAVGIPWSFDAARFGDFSYGLYIVHFPIIQGLVAMGLYSVSAPLALTAAFLLPLATAAALWWFVERPWLRSDSAYRAT